MASGKKSNSNAGKRTLFAIVALVVIALDIWWVASGQGRDIFSPQPAVETKTERKMYVELCGPPLRRHGVGHRPATRGS